MECCNFIPILTDSSPQHSQARGGGDRGGPVADRVLAPVGIGVPVRPVARPLPVYNWQATKTTIKDRFQYLFNNELQSDVRFVVGRGVSSQRIPAHRVS